MPFVPRSSKMEKPPLEHLIAKLRGFIFTLQLLYRTDLVEHLVALRIPQRLQHLLRGGHLSHKREYTRVTANKRTHTHTHTGKHTAEA